MTLRLMFRPEEAAEVLGLGRSTVFALMKTGELESVKIGKSRRVPGEALEDYVARLRVTA